MHKSVVWASEDESAL